MFYGLRCGKEGLWFCEKMAYLGVVIYEEGEVFGEDMPRWRRLMGELS